MLRTPNQSSQRLRRNHRKGRTRSRHTPRRDNNLPYRSRTTLLSQGETAFFQPLRRALRGEYLIMSKVRLADLVRCSAADWHGGFGGAISQKHVDFVLCDPHTTRFVLAVELDDRTHDKPYRRKRDLFVNAALRKAGINLLRVRARSHYPLPWLRSLVLEAIDRCRD